MQSKDISNSDHQTILKDLLLCPQCGHDHIIELTQTLRCEGCHREYIFTNNIADLAPSSLDNPHLAQQVMQSPFYASAYEDRMRPGLTRFATRRTLSQEYRLALKYLELKPDTMLLDIGCGTGNFTRFFAKAAPCDPTTEQKTQIIGLDLSVPMLSHAVHYSRRDGLLDHLLFLRADATRLPLKNLSFDRLHCAGSLHLFNDIDEALRNFARVLKPDGILVVGTFIKSTNRLKALAESVMEASTHFHWFKYEDLHQRIMRAGFDMIAESISESAITIQARRI